MRAKALASSALVIQLAAAASFSLAADLSTVAERAVISDGMAQIGKKAYPLPPGDWILAARRTGDILLSGGPGSSSGRTFQVLLANGRGGIIRAGIYIATTVDPVQQVESWNGIAPCGPKGALFTERIDTSMHFPECLDVNYAADLAGDGVTVPGAALAVTYQKYSASSFLLVRVYVNPETSTRKPITALHWNSANWYRDRDAGDAARKRYLDEIVKWARTLPGPYSAAFAEKDPLPGPPEVP
jgi:hypothetical protein